MSRRRNPTAPSRALVDRYTALHEGRRPDGASMETLPTPPKWFIELGPVPEFTYLKKTPDGEHAYQHKFARWAMPTLVHDDKGKLHIVDQDALVTTTAGIEDNHMAKSKQRHIQHWSPAGNRYLSLSPARHNPFDKTAMKKALMASGAVGLGVAASSLGMAYLFNKVDMLKNLTGYKSAAAYAGIGLGASLLVQGLAGAPTGRTNVADIVAASLGISGVSIGALKAYATAMVPATTTTQAPPASTTQPPAQGAYRRY